MTLFTIFVLQTDYLFCLMSRCYMHSAVFAVAFGIMSKRLNDAKVARCALVLCVSTIFRTIHELLFNLVLKQIGIRKYGLILLWFPAV